MIPLSTKYRLASGLPAYNRARAFLKGQAQTVSDLTAPTVLAIREDSIIAVLATTANKKAIIAGPIATSVEGNPAFVVRRMIEAYETVLTRLGIKTYLFWFWDHQTPWMRMIESMSVLPWMHDGERVWYKREL